MNRLRFQVCSCRTRVGVLMALKRNGSVVVDISARGECIDWSDGQTPRAYRCGTMCSCSCSCGMALLVMA